MARRRKGKRRLICLWNVAQQSEPVEAEMQLFDSKTGRGAPVSDDTDRTDAVPSQLPSPVRGSVYAGCDGSDGSDGNSCSGEAEARTDLRGRAKALASQSRDNAVTAVTFVTPDLSTTNSTCSDCSRDDGIGDDGPGDGRRWSASKLPDRRSGWPQGAREQFEERAAIIEYEGGLSRKEAEEWAETLIREIFSRSQAFLAEGE